MTTTTTGNQHGHSVNVTVDGWRCDCGNYDALDGFYPSNCYGHEVEPTPEAWDGSSYVCGGCDLVFDMNTGKPSPTARRLHA